MTEINNQLRSKIDSELQLTGIDNQSRLTFIANGKPFLACFFSKFVAAQIPFLHWTVWCGVNYHQMKLKIKEN